MPSQTPQNLDLGTRESLLTPSQTAQAQRHRSQSAASQSSVKSSSSATTTDGASLADVEARYREESEMVQKAAVMHRPNFAIDAIGDSDGEEDEEGEGGDDAVMDEVEAFLKAHGDDDEGFKGEQKKVAAGQLTHRAQQSGIANGADLLKAQPVNQSGQRSGGDLVDI
jgi:hypothetical protein